MRHSKSCLGIVFAFLVADCGGGSGSPPPTATLNVSKTTVNSGESATLTWSSTDASSCTASGGWTGTLATSGTQTSAALTGATTFSLVCSGGGGTSTVATVTVNIVPTATLAATPSVVPTGGASTLTWSSSNATSCTASDGWSGGVAGSGTQSIGPFSANASYALTCAGPGGTSAVATAVVTVSDVVMSLAPSTAAITLGRTQQFTATVPGGGPATWTVDGVAGGNGTVGTITDSGLYTAGTAAGAHVIVATSVANTTQTGTSTAAVTDLAGVYTYHNDLGRDGANTQEYALNTSNVNTSHFGKLTSCTVDGAIYGQPLWVANLTVGGTQRNVVFVATQHDSLYAFDADTVPCAKLWSVSLIDTTHGGATGESAVPYTLLGTSHGDIQPEVGVTSTPVIDPTTGIIYVVSKSVDSGHTHYYQRVHAIDVTTGNEKAGSPATIAATFPGTGDGGTTVAFNARLENQRPGLAFVNGLVYVAWASHEDAGPWYGWVIGYQYSGSALVQKAVFNTAPNKQQSGIWMSGGAPAADASGNLYVVTGNGTFNATSTTAPNNDYGDTLLQLSSGLSVKQWFTPTDQDTDMQNDDDFGAGGAALLADLPAGNTVTHALICGGKDGALYIINRDMLGGFGDPAAVQRVNANTGIFSTTAYWNGNFYLGGIDYKLQAFTLNTSTAQISAGSSSSHSFPFPGTTPSVSAAGTQQGIVWTIDVGKYCTTDSTACGAAVLYAYDATNLGTELWNSSKTAADAAGYPVKFSVPTVANGRVYVGTRGNNTGVASTSINGELDIFGLK